MLLSIIHNRKQDLSSGQITITTPDITTTDQNIFDEKKG